jgi:hypothetical protein
LRFNAVMDDMSSLNQAVRAGVPREAVALYARWWQLEGWLRQLAYFVLRATWGITWESEINARAVEYARRDNLVHLASPDTGDLLAYLDFSLLLSLIDDQWSQFEPFLLRRQIWLGKCEELKIIRNRIAHLRRPGKRDRARVETTLEDLEPGYRQAVRALSATDRLGERPDEQVIQTYQRGPLADLIDHARRKYGLDISLSVSRMPWAELPDPPAPVTGTAGALWQLSVGGPDAWVSPHIFQRNLPADAREALVYTFMSMPYGATFAAAAVDDASTTTLALQGAFEAFLHSITNPLNVPREAVMKWAGDISSLDPRILVEHLFAVIDDPDAPGSIFGVS